MRTFCFLLLTTFTTSGLVATSGCGPGAVEGETIATAQQSYDSANAAFAAGDYATARTSLDQALTNASGLNPDLYVDALLMRSICLSVAGELDAAAADITEAEQGATEMAKVHVARGVLLSKQGDAAGAKAEFASAKKADPKVVIPQI